MFTVKLILDKRKKSKKGYPIKVELYDQSTKLQTQRSTGYYQTASKLRMSPELTALLHSYQDRIAYCNKNSFDHSDAMEVLFKGYHGDENEETELLRLKKRIAQLEKRQPTDIYKFIDGMIEEKEMVGKSTRHFEEAVAQMKNFNGRIPLDINSIDYGFLKRFESYKRRMGNGNGSGIKKTIRTLRTVYNEAKRRGKIHDLTIDPFNGLEIPILPSESKEASWSLQELKQLFKLQYNESTTESSRQNMERVRDLFLFQIAIGGHDLADVANLRWHDCKDGRIQFQRFKLRRFNTSPIVNNMLNYYAQEVIDKYGAPGEERIFSFFANPTKERYRQQNGYQLKSLSRISKNLGIAKLSTKTPRYIFRSLAGELGINEVLINQIMGHKPSNVSHRYQLNLSQEAQDEAHRKVLSKLFSKP